MHTPNTPTLFLSRATPRRCGLILSAFARFTFLLIVSFVLMVSSHAQSVSPNAAAPADSAKRSFNLPADGAERTLKLFSEQSGRALLVATKVVKGIQTNAVQGELTAREALDRMLAGTGLVPAQDEKNGAFTVRRENSGPNAPRAAQTRSDRPVANPPVEAVSASTAKARPPGEQDTIVLSPFEVTTDQDTGFVAAG
ncbi:MAG: STN domain-containing protein, partial [Opitutaceae bacterium]